MLGVAAVVASTSLMVVLVTHDHRAAAYGDRILTLRDGRIVDEVEGGAPGATVVRLPRRV